MAKVQYKDQTEMLELFVKLDWQKILQVQQVKTLKQILEKYADVFKGEIGKLRGTKVKIHIKEDVQSHFHKPKVEAGTLAARDGRDHHTSSIFRLGSTHCASSEG